WRRPPRRYLAEVIAWCQRVHRHHPSRTGGSERPSLRRGPVNHPPLVDITTTSVGRCTIVETYESFFAHLRFSGRLRILVTIDPAYEVDDNELAETRRYLDALPTRYPAVERVR